MKVERAVMMSSLASQQSNVVITDNQRENPRMRGLNDRKQGINCPRRNRDACSYHDLALPPA
jgi:hypothetical protein